LIITTNFNAQDLFKARRLTSEPAREGFPSWSPDGLSIVYQYSDRNDTTGKNGLWQISSDGKVEAQIFRGIAEHPKWSPDDRFIVFDADTGQSIKMIPAVGGNTKKFLPDNTRIDKGGLPCWSPDALQIAFKNSEASLCIYNFKTKKVSRIFNKEGMIPLPACWTSDGKYVLIALMGRQTRKSTIWKISSDGKETKQITGHHENFYRHLALSPDESLLVYTVMEGRYLGLYVMLAEGSISIPLAVSSDGHNEAPSWSPDGKKIAFGGSRSWNADIWIMDVDIEQIINEIRLSKE